VDVVKDVISILITLGGAISIVWLVIRPGLEKRVMTSAAASQYKLDRSIEGDKAHVALLMDERNEAKTEIAELRKEIAEMREQIADMREQLATTVVQKTEREKQYDTLTKQHADIMKTNAELHRENIDLKHQIDQMNALMTEAQLTIDAQNAKIQKLTEIILKIRPDMATFLNDTKEFKAHKLDLTATGWKPSKFNDEVKP